MLGTRPNNYRYTTASSRRRLITAPRLSIPASAPPANFYIPLSPRSWRGTRGHATQTTYLAVINRDDASRRSKSSRSRTQRTTSADIGPEAISNPPRLSVPARFRAIFGASARTTNSAGTRTAVWKESRLDRRKRGYRVHKYLDSQILPDDVFLTFHGTSVSLCCCCCCCHGKRSLHSWLQTTAFNVIEKCSGVCRTLQRTLKILYFSEIRFYRASPLIIPTGIYHENNTVESTLKKIGWLGFRNYVRLLFAERASNERPVRAPLSEGPGASGRLSGAEGGADYTVRLSPW